jgi:hypothetical protein
MNTFFVTLSYIIQLIKSERMTDNDAFEKLKQGDSGAMEWLYRSKRDYFVGYFIGNYGLSVDDAEELAMDALIGLVNSAKRNNDRDLTAQLASLWIKIGRNMELAKQGKMKKMAVENWDDFINFTKNTEGSFNPFETDDFEEALPLLMPYFNDMKNPCQSVLHEYFWNGKTDKEISALFSEQNDMKNMSKDAVKMKRLRCIDELKNLIFNHLKKN